MKCSSVGNRLALVLGAVLVLSYKTATAGLVAYWPFDGDPKDKVGNRVALLHGQARYEDGYLGKAVRLNGRPDGVELPVGGLIGTLSNCTIALWVNVGDERATWYRIFSFGRDPTAEMYLTGNAVPPGALQLFIGNGKTHKWVPASHPLGRGWHHVAVVIDAKQQRSEIYLDGVAVMLEGGSLPPGLVPSVWGSITENWLGCSSYADGSHFKGAVDEMAIFDHALSTSQVRLLYQSSAVSFLYDGAQNLVTVFDQAAWSVINDKPERARTMLREQLVRYEAKAPRLSGVSASTMEAPLGALYALLAEANRVSGAPTQEVVTPLAKALRFAGRNEPYARSLVALYQRVPRDTYAALVQQSLEVNTLTPHHLSGIAQTFHVSEQWDAFEAFLRVVLERNAEASAFAAAAQTALEKTPWSARLTSVLAAVPRVDGYCAVQKVQQAQALVQERRYAEAALVYRDLLGASCGPAERMQHEFELIRCAFLQGQYAEAVSLTDAYLKRYPTLSVRQLKETLLLKASALLGRRQIEDAIQVCLDVIAVPPETQADQEAHYLIGYCQVLQGREDQAKETLDHLVAAWPRSPEASRSRLLLARISSESQ